MKRRKLSDEAYDEILYWLSAIAFGVIMSAIVVALLLLLVQLQK